MCTTSSYNPGRNENSVAFIFSCPGKDEQDGNKPVAGQTGKNLELVLKYLNKRNPEIFPYTGRYDYKICNSSQNVHFEEKTKDTEPSNDEVLNVQNVRRVADQLTDNIRYVITMGEKAKLLINSPELDEHNFKIVECEHLSFSHVNTTINQDIYGNRIIPGGPDNNEKRMEVIAQRIIGNLD